MPENQADNPIAPAPSARLPRAEGNAKLSAFFDLSDLPEAPEPPPEQEDAPAGEPVTAAPPVQPAAQPRREAAAAKEAGGPWLVVIGLETVPHREIMPKNLDPSVMPKAMYHRIAALAFVRASIQRDANGCEHLTVLECRAGGTAESDERTILSAFWRQFEKWEPSLAGFNSRGFILPVLRYRSMHHKLTAKVLHEKGDKWSNYLSRYPNSFHVDVMDALSDQRPAASLVDAASVMGLPLRSQDCPDPEVLVADGKIEDVRAMAEANVATTFLALIRWKLLTGVMNLAAHDAAAASLRRVLAARPDPRPIMVDFLKSWPPE